MRYLAIQTEISEKKSQILIVFWYLQKLLPSFDKQTGNYGRSGLYISSGLNLSHLPSHPL